MFENLYRRDGDSEDVDECEKSKSRTRTGRSPDSLHSVNQLFLRTYARVMPLLPPIPILWPRDFQGKSFIRFRSHGVALRHNFLVAYTKLVIGNVSNPL